MSTRSTTLLCLRIGTVATLLIIGCATHSNSFAPPTTQMATDIDPATTQPSYWYNQPSPAMVEGTDFDTLWDTAERVARAYFFKIDRTDYRSGLLTTEPLVSAQFFEPWRRDVQTVDDSVESSLATIRRTIRYEFLRTEDGKWRVTPKVLVERRTVAERRITSVVLYRSAFRKPLGNTRDLPSGTKESDQGIYLPSRYWYPIGRDETLEKDLAKQMTAHLQSLAKK